MRSLRTQVAIIGAGPAGLMLGHLLHRAGIDTIILENRTQEHVIERVRAGVLEQGTVDLMTEVGVGDRLHREGMVHRGIYLAFAGRRHRIDLASLTGGRTITIYGQNEVVKDLVDARHATARPLLFQVDAVRLHDLTTPRPRVRFHHANAAQEVTCDFVAGCDGFHGVCRPSIPASHVKIFERVYRSRGSASSRTRHPLPTSLSTACTNEGSPCSACARTRLRGSTCSARRMNGSRAWSDERIWKELRERLETVDGWRPNEGPILQKNVTGMRSFVVEPMRYGRMLLAGDAAHIVPPTGAKGLNLAMADVTLLAGALARSCKHGDDSALEAYSATALTRAWRAQRFSWWMTSMLHRADTDNPFDHRRQLAELDYVVSSDAAMTSLAENYAGFPFAPIEN